MVKLQVRNCGRFAGNTFHPKVGDWLRLQKPLLSPQQINLNMYLQFICLYNTYVTCDIQTLQYSLLFGSCVRLLSEIVSYLSLKLCLHTQCQHSTRICFPRGIPLILPNCVKHPPKITEGIVLTFAQP